MRRDLAQDDTGQMLLMTGLILMFALLTMSLNTIKTASLGEPYDAHEDAVLDAAAETLAVWQPLVENRSSELFAAGANETEAAQAAAESAAADLMHRTGSRRGGRALGHHGQRDWEFAHNHGERRHLRQSCPAVRDLVGHNHHRLISGGWLHSKPYRGNGEPAAIHPDAGGCRLPSIPRLRHVVR